MSDIVARMVLKDEFSAKMGKIKKNTEKAGDEMTHIYKGLKKRAEEYTRAQEEAARKIPTANQKIAASIKKMNAEGEKIARMRRSLADVGDGAEETNSKVRLLRNGIASLSAVVGIGGLAKSFIGAVTEVENLETQFKSLLGSTDAAKGRIKELSEFAAKTPFQLPEIAKASRVLETLTKGALSTNEGLALVGDAAASTGSDFEGLAMWVGRAYDGLHSNRPIGEAMMRMQELGLVSGEARNEIEELQKASRGKDAWKILQGELKRTKGGMEDLSKTTSGLMSTMRDNWNLLLTSMNNGDFMKIPIKRMNTFLETTREAIEHMHMMNELENKKQFADLRLLITLSEKHQRLKELGAKFGADEHEKEGRRSRAIIKMAEDLGVPMERLLEMRRKSALAGAEGMKAQEGWNKETIQGLDSIISRNQKRLEQAAKIEDQKNKKEKDDTVTDNTNVIRSQYKAEEELEAEFNARRRNKNSTQRALEFAERKIDHQKRIEDDKQYLEERFTQNDELLAQDKENKKELEDNEKYYTQVLKREAEHRKSIRMAELNLAMALTSSLSTISRNALGTSKKNAKARKSIALSEAIINTGLGVTKALSSSAPPLNLINAGIVSAQGTASISTIASQKFAQGGIVKSESGVPNIGDKTLVRVNAGEGVFTQDQMKALGGMMGTNNISPTLVVNGNVDSSTVPKLNDSLQSFADKIIGAIRGNELDLVGELNLVTQ